MKLSNLFKESQILIHCKDQELTGLIYSMLETMREDVGDERFDEVAARVIQQEKSNLTITPMGACLLHFRLVGLDQLRVAVAVPETPILNPRNADQQISLIFLILAPQEQNTLMLQTLAAIARLLSAKTFIQAVKRVRSPSRLIRLIEESGIDVKRNLCAGDIMEPIEHSVRLDDPLVKAVETLSEARDEGIPVFDEKGALVGEITSREFLVLGMPKYVHLMANPDMLHDFEPFENYFRNELKMRVRDIYRRELFTVPPSAPIVRVAHIMITRHRRRIYVLQDDKVEGIIFRKSILTRIMKP
jgi:CBS domain-containing protein